MSVHIHVSFARRRVETPTPHYTNTCVKLTIVTHLSFSERIEIANLSFDCCPPIPSSAFFFRCVPHSLFLLLVSLSGLFAAAYMTTFLA